MRGDFSSATINILLGVTELEGECDTPIPILIPACLYVSIDINSIKQLR